MYFVGHFGFFNSFRGTFYYGGLSGCQSKAISKPIKCQPLHVWYNVTRLSYKCSTKFLKFVFFLGKMIAKLERTLRTGADPGFLERGFICIMMGGRFADFIYFF